MPTVDCGFDNSDELALAGPTVAVEVGFDPDARFGDGDVPRLQSGPLPALVDTGAGESCIDSELAIRLNLPVIGRQQVSGIGGMVQVDVHLAQINLPGLGTTIYGRFAGVHLIAGGQPHYALIGRDFLSHYTMTYDGRRGVVTLSND